MVNLNIRHLPQSFSCCLLFIVLKQLLHVFCPGFIRFMGGTEWSVLTPSYLSKINCNYQYVTVSI